MVMVLKERSAEKLIMEMGVGGAQQSAQRIRLAEGHSAAPFFFFSYVSFTLGLSSNFAK